MIEVMKDLPEGVDGVRARGKVTKDDYESVLMPLLDEARSKGRRIRFLYHFGPDFESFTAGAAWDDMRVGFRYLRLFERCAIVSDTGWIRQASRAAAVMMPCPVQTFSEDQLKQAVTWLAAPDDETGLTHKLLPDKGVLVLEVHRPLRAEDFDAVALTVDPWIETHGKLGGVVVHAREFPGWENFGGLLRHFRFVRDHHHNVNRVAVVTGGMLTHMSPKLVEHFIDAEVKHFDYDQLDGAIAWAGEPAGVKTSS